MMDLLRRIFPHITDPDIPPPVEPLPDFPDLTPAAVALSRAQAKSYLAERAVTQHQLRQLASLELLRWRASPPARGERDAGSWERQSD